jgi:uncharacterized protein YoxC
MNTKSTIIIVSLISIAIITALAFLIIKFSESSLATKNLQIALEKNSIQMQKLEENNNITIERLTDSLLIQNIRMTEAIQTGNKINSLLVPAMASIGSGITNINQDFKENTTTYSGGMKVGLFTELLVNLAPKLLGKSLTPGEIQAKLAPDIEGNLNISITDKEKTYIRNK